jgi:hypothetical protein
MAPDGGLRASDQDRERTTAQLREHFAAGRLSDEELSERSQAAYAARTHAELQGLLADLPQLPASPVTTRAELVQRRHELQRRLLQQTGGTLGVFVVCTVIWLASGAHGQFWPIWIALVAVIALLRNGWRLYGPAPELDRVEQDLARREHRRAGRRG